MTYSTTTRGAPGKHTQGTFMTSNHLVTHQAHKNGQYYDLKRSKILFNCKRDQSMTQKFQILKNFQMTLKMFLDIDCGGHCNIKIKHF